MKWTKEQLEAITSCGTNIIVSAGAGSVAADSLVLQEKEQNTIATTVNKTSIFFISFSFFCLFYHVFE